MRLHKQSMPDDPQIQAFLYGPIVLAADLGDKGIEPGMLEGSSAPELWKLPALSVPGIEFAPAKTIPAGADNAEQHIPEQVMPSLRASSHDPAAWIKPGDGPLTFQTTGQTKDLILRPVNSLFGKRYSVYFAVT
jgi:hypothetical protein